MLQRINAGPKKTIRMAVKTRITTVFLLIFVSFGRRILMLLDLDEILRGFFAGSINLFCQSLLIICRLKPTLSSIPPHEAELLITVKAFGGNRHLSRNTSLEISIWPFKPALWRC